MLSRQVARFAAEECARSGPHCPRRCHPAANGAAKNTAHVGTMESIGNTANTPLSNAFTGTSATSAYAHVQCSLNGHGNGYIGQPFLDPHLDLLQSSDATYAVGTVDSVNAVNVMNKGIAETRRDRIQSSAPLRFPRPSCHRLAPAMVLPQLSFAAPRWFG
jgi:hypothetical protein